MHRFYLARRFALFFPDGDSGGGGPASGADATGTAAGAPAATPTGGAGAVAGTPVAMPDWREAITDAGLKQYVTDKGFKEPGDVIKAMRETEAKHAAPATPDEYALGDTDFAKTASTWFHEQGLSAGQAKGLTEKWNAFVEQQTAADAAARLAQGEAQMTALKSEWGDSYDRNLELGRQAMRKFGLSGEFVDRMAGEAGDAETVRVFSRIGAALSEGTLNPGGAGGSGGAALTQEERAAKFYSNTKR